MFNRLVNLIWVIAILLIPLVFADVGNDILHNSTGVINPYNTSNSNTSKSIIKTEFYGVVNGDVTYYSTGAITSSGMLSFDGDGDWIEFNSTNATDHHRTNTENWTYICNVVTKGIINAVGIGIMIGMTDGKGSGSAGASSMWIDDTAGNDNVGCAISETTGNNLLVQEGFENVTDGKNHSLACVYNRTSSTSHTVTYYRDGVRRAQGNFAFAIQSPAFDLIVGRNDGTNSHYFEGNLSECKLVNRTVIASEILHEYNQTWNGTINQETASVVLDTTPPVVNITNKNTSQTIRINDVLNITAYITGTATTSNITFNLTGNWDKYNFTSSLTGDTQTISQNITVNLTRGNVINASVVACDSVPNCAINSTLITVANTVPNGTNFVNVTGKHYNRNITKLNWTACNEPDIETVNYVVYWDLDITPTSTYYNGTDLNISTNWTSDNTYFYQIKCMDSVSESALSPVFNLTLDTGLPTLTTNCTNNTFTRFNLTCKFSIEDPFPYNLSVEVIRGSSSYYLRTNQTTVERFINITFSINLTEDGNYTIYINASDSDKTSPKIEGKLSKQKQAEETHIYTDAEKSIRMDLNLEFENLTGGTLPLPLNLKTFSEFNSKGTHLEFGLNFTTDKQGTLPIFNIKTINVSLFYLNSTGFNNFVWKPYGIDFEGELKVNNQKKEYGVKVKKVGQQNNYQAILIPNETLNIGDNVTFTSTSVFGLNVIDIFYNIVNDQTDQNIRNITPLNNTFTSLAVNFTANITETNPDKMELFINSTGTWHLNRTASYTNNITANFSLFSLDYGFYKWTVCANDTAGGRSCFAENYTITVDAITPAITLTFPPNGTVVSEEVKPGINFRFSANETVKNCTLFLGNSIVANDSTQKTSYNFSLIVDFGTTTWNATCYDLANNRGSSGVFTLEVKQITGGGGGPSPSSPSGSGGVSTSELTDNPQYIYTIEYICKVTKEFIEEHTVNNTYKGYTSEDLAHHQLRVTKDLGYSISERTLKEYIDYSESYCNVQKDKKKIIGISKKIEFLSIGNLSYFDFDNDILNFTLQSYIPLFDEGVNIGSLKYYKDKNAKGIIDFFNIFFRIKISDPYSDNPNFLLFGPRIFPWTLIGLFVYIRQKYKKRVASPH